MRLNYTVMAQMHWIRSLFIFCEAWEISRTLKVHRENKSGLICDGNTGTSHSCWHILMIDLTYDLTCAYVTYPDEIIIRHNKKKKKLMMALRILLVTFGM